MYDFSDFKSKVADAQDWLAKEYQGLRTGRATPQLLESIQAESYGARMPLNQAANVGVEDARTLRVVAFDPSQVKEIERAITNADLGVGVSADEKGVRVTFPELTAERRETLIKLGKEKLEDARQSVRAARDEVWSDIQEQEKGGEMSEDDKFRAKEEMEKIVSETNDALDALFSGKEKEIAE